MKVVLAILILIFHIADTQETYYKEENEQTLSCPANTTDMDTFGLSIDAKVIATCTYFENKEFKCGAMFDYIIFRNKSGFHVIIPPPRKKMPRKLLCKYDDKELLFNIRKIDKPSMPRNVTVTNITAETATLSWSKPEDDGGKPVKGYILEKRDASRQTWTGLAEVADTAPFDVKGLVEGGQYIFRIAAENIVGVGKFAESDIITAENPFDAPVAPDAPLIKEVFKDNVFLAWQPPVDDGGTPVTGYIVERQSNITSRWIAVNKEPVSGTELRVMDLVEDNTYQFRVIALNKAGPSKPSEPSHTVKAIDPYNKPSMPRNVTVTNITAETATLSWSEPEDDGGKPVKGYILEKRDANRKTWTGLAAVADTAPFDVKGLVEGGQYIFRIAAENIVGVSRFAESDIITAENPFDAPVAPDAPFVKEVFKDNVFLAWQPPVDDGGTSVTGYIVERQSNITSRWIAVNKEPLSGTELRVMDLVEDNTYQFRVIALNKAGPSKPSEPSHTVKAIDPYSVPGRPGVPEVTGTDKSSVALKWTAPESDGGATIFNYVVEFRPAGTSQWLHANETLIVPDTTFSVTGLEENTEYEFRVRAENKAGVGQASQSTLPVKVVKSIVGMAPKLLKPLQDIAVVVPSDAILKCDIDVGEPEAEIKWFRGSNEIRNSPKYEISYKDKVASLVIHKTEPQAADVYRCEVSNRLGKVQTEGTLSIHTMPVLEYDNHFKSAQTVKAGSSIVLKVKASGIPSPSISWLLDGKVLEKSDRVSLETTPEYSTLTIKNAAIKDTGVYTIIAENVVGKALADFKFNIKGNVGQRDDKETILWGCIGTGLGVIVLVVLLHIITTYIISIKDIKKKCCNKCASTDLELEAEENVLKLRDVVRKRKEQQSETNGGTNSDTKKTCTINVDIDPEKVTELISDFL